MRREPLSPCPICGHRRPYVARGEFSPWVQIRCADSWEDGGLSRGCNMQTAHFSSGPHVSLDLAEAQARFHWNRRNGAFGDRTFIDAAWKVQLQRAEREARRTPPERTTVKQAVKRQSGRS